VLPWSAAPWLQQDEHIAYMGHFVGLHADFFDGSGNGRGDFDDALIGLNLDHWLIELDLLAWLDQPAQHFRLVNALAHIWDLKL
jgi:hypothetical protein